MTTDRELLDLAAKAAGIDLIPMEIKNVSFQGDDRFIGFMADPVQCPRGWFNPLTDDGDALRLAVKLGYIHMIGTWLGCYVVRGEYEKDPYAATRRAIVKAAAEIGREMK